MHRKFYPLHHLLFLLFILISPMLYAGKSIGHLADYYFANHGQVTDVNGEAADNVLFYNTGKRMSVFVTTTGYAICVKETKAGKTTWHKTEIKLDSAHITAAQVIITPLKGAPQLNFYTPKTGKKAISTTGSTTVLLKDVYPGVDSVWGINKSGQLQHDFMVNYGADAGNIKYTVTGNGLGYEYR